MTTPPRTSDQLLERLWDSSGTDLLLTPGAAPMIRVDGELSRLADQPPRTAEQTDALVRELLTPEQYAVFVGGREVDFSFTWRKLARLRGSAFRTKGAAALSLRLIPHKIPSLSDLGIPAVVGRFGTSTAPRTPCTSPPARAGASR
ncbi:MAG: hypothetical protein H7323_08880 [Frankiales bacterium]|nr:hypothetical protein [Frankiales bacterium]